MRILEHLTLLETMFSERSLTVFGQRASKHLLFYCYFNSAVYATTTFWWKMFYSSTLLLNVHYVLARSCVEDFVGTSLRL